MSAATTPAAATSVLATATAAAPASSLQEGSRAAAPAVVLPDGSPLAGTPDLVIGDTSVAPGERMAHVQVTLSGPSRRPLAWKCLTSNGTAWAGAYYDTTRAEVMFKPGETLHVVDVPIKRDLGDLTLKLDCAWPQMYPSVGGASGIIRQGSATATAAARATPVYPEVQRDARRALAFSSTFQERIVPGVVSGTWRSRFDWGRVQTANKEIAPYTDATTDAGVNPHPIVDGKRVLRAEYVPTRDEKTGKSYDFSASLIDSANLFTFQYGYIELRVKFARAQGSATAFWLLPASGKWPPEIDIFETGLGDRSVAQSTIHFLENGAVAAEGVMLPQVVEDGEWHTIGLDWTRDWQVTFIDGVEAVRRPNTFNEPMKIVIDVSVGGLGPDPVNPQRGWKSEMVLDYLKVWQ